MSLAFSAQPNTATAGLPITRVQVEARDSVGKMVANFGGTVTLALGVNPGSDSLEGATTATAVAGIATFADLSLDKSASGYRLTATSGSLAPATSSSFSVIGGSATRLAFTVQPATSAAGKSISPSVKVTAQDSLGNTDPAFIGAVTVALGQNPPGGTLSGVTTVVAAAGVATFSSLSLNKVGTGYTLTATATGLAGASSSSFGIVPNSANHLVFTVQPSAAPAGDSITPAMVVTALDSAGNVATGFIGNVSVAITGGTGTTGANLSGARTIAAVAGVATFSTLSINLAGKGYTLTATASGTTGTVSAPFDITAGGLATLAFSTQPSASTAGASIAPAVQVTARDSLGNTVTTFNGNVSVAIAPGTGAPGATLSGTKTVAAVSGIATFSSLSIDSAATGYKLTATATGLTAATSSSFTITAGAATKLLFTVQPSTSASGRTISPSVRVAAVDPFGNPNPAFVGNVTVAIGHNPSGGTLSGTATVAAFGGVATFSTLSIDKVGIGYTLTAAASGLTGATSTSFDITSGSATQLLITVQPRNATAGAAISPAVQVTALDAGGNPAAGFTSSVTVAITSGSGTAGATLSGTKTVSAVAGMATFSTLSINLAGNGYTLTATASGLSSAVSTSFNITAGPAASLQFTVQPGKTITSGATFSPAVQVTAFDAVGNVATSFTGSVTVVITAGTGAVGAALSGTKTVGASAGVATFSGLSIDKADNAYTLTASAGGVTSGVSASFSIVSGPAVTLGFTAQPSNTTAGSTITPAVQVTAFDAAGNIATGFTGNVTVAITSGTGPIGATLSGTAIVAAVAGAATFSTLSINLAGNGYTLTASATGPSGATSASFNIM